VGPIVLAVVGLPIAAVLDIAGTILSLAILVGLVIPIFLCILVFVIPLMMIFGTRE
jgi:hypothetical protein